VLSRRNQKEVASWVGPPSQPKKILKKFVYHLGLITLSEAGGVERRSTSMMDICHMKMRDPNLAARASDKIGIFQDWDLESNLAAQSV
jgi:hypothetical protein